MKFFLLRILMTVVMGLPLAQASTYVKSNLTAIESTLSYALLKGNRGKKIYMGSSHGSERPAGYTGSSRYYFRLFKNKGPAPVIFFSVGLGGDTKSGACRYLARLLLSQGYHVVVLGSTFSDEFALLAGSSPYVGQPRVDAYDLYTKMISIKKVLPKYGVRATGWGLTGYSLGALVSAFMARIDSREGYFNFSKVVLINPPVDLLYGMKKLDQLHSRLNGQNLAQQANLALKWANFKSQMASTPFNPALHRQKLKSAGLSTRDQEGLVGFNFRTPLRDVIFFSQEKYDVGVLPIGDWKNRRRLAKKFGYQDYIQHFISRFYQSTSEGRRVWKKFYGNHAYSVSFLNRHNGMKSLGSFLRKNKRIVVMHNQDDFLLRSSDLKFLRQTLRERLVLFPEGGHLGNLWHRTLQAHYLHHWKLAF